MFHDRIAVVPLAGEPDLAACQELLRAGRAALTHTDRLQVDMSRTVALDAAVIEVLLALQTDGRARGSDVTLLDVSPRLRRALQLAGIEDDFDYEASGRPVGLTQDQVAGIDRPQVVPLPERIDLAEAADPHFERLTAQARQAMGTQRAAVVLLDGRHQVFAGRSGEPTDAPREDSLSESLCQHVVTGAGPLVLRDVAGVELTGAGRAPFIASYAAVPLTDHTGRVVGAFCVTDDVPREWSRDDLDTLAAFAESASSELQLRSAVARAAVLADRERLAARLVDAVFHDLVSVSLLIDSAQSISVGRQGELLSDASAKIEATIKNLRATIFDTST